MEHLRDGNGLPKPSREDAERLLADRLAQEQQAASQPKLRPLLTHVDLGERSSVCEKHGPFAESGHRLRSGSFEIWSGCSACAVEVRAAEELAAKEAERQRAAERRSSAIDSAAIPPRFRSRDFASFVANTPQKRRALTVARDFAEQFPEVSKRGQGLIFSGLPGTGKSHLAASILLHLIEGRHRVQYISCMGLIRAVRETWRKDSDESERQILAQFGRLIDLLVIDEVGVQYGTDSEQTILFEILDRRYSEMRPTILLTNQDRDGLKSFVGDRVYDRLTETCKWVPFDWESYRPTARKESQA